MRVRRARHTRATSPKPRRHGRRGTRDDGVLFPQSAPPSPPPHVAVGPVGRHGVRRRKEGGLEVGGVFLRFHLRQNGVALGLELFFRLLLESREHVMRLDVHGARNGGGLALGRGAEPLGAQAPVSRRGTPPSSTGGGPPSRAPPIK